MDQAANENSQVDLELLLIRSRKFSEGMDALLTSAKFDSSSKSRATIGMCYVSLEHVDAFRMLLGGGCPTSAASLLRLQFEALTRAIWLGCFASEEVISNLLGPFTPESEKFAKKMPMASVMIENIGSMVGKTVPSEAHQALVDFKGESWQAMNSFVHGGIHALQRRTRGFPVILAIQILKQSNALAAVTYMVLALVTGDKRISKGVGHIQREYLDCLPPPLS